MDLMALDEYTPTSKNSWKENENDDQENSMAFSDLQR